MDKQDPFYLTDDYIRLSVLIGYLALQWDTILGIPYFVPKTRIRATHWDLSWEWLEELKREAASKGVPERYLKTPKDVLEMFAKPHFYEKARQLQRERDEEIGLISKKKPN